MLVGTGVTLTEYERQRAQKIERNNERLRELGLISVQEEYESNCLAWKKQCPARSLSSKRTNDCVDETDDYQPNQDETHYIHSRHVNEETPTLLNDQKKTVNQSIVHASDASSQPSRKSRRLAGMDVEAAASCDSLNIRSADKTFSRCNVTADSDIAIRKGRLEIAIDAALQPDAMQRAARVNRTATYQHALMRVRTMKAEALHNRIRTIERAAGKHCVIKMAIFWSCLRDEGMDGLAEHAHQALERLKELQYPPDNFDAIL
jgi:hypothetical protein